jgi:hypothetical protein
MMMMAILKKKEIYAHLKDTWYLTASDDVDSDRSIDRPVKEDGSQWEIA